MRNIFLITVDDLCADHVGHLGYKKDITPNFDSFSKQNISFTQAVATGPRTTLSFPSILFSLYASEYFNQKKYGSKDNLASFFKKIGYKTAAFNSNPHFRMWGFSKGFEYFEDFLYKTGSARNKTAEKLKRKIVKTVGRKSFIVKKLSKILTHLSPDIALPYADAETINNQSLKWIREQKNQPVFCWIHYMDPHYPFIPPKEYIDIDVTKKDILTANRLHKIAENYKEIIPEEDIKTLISLYDGEIRYLDRYIGDFLNRLKNMGLYDDSVIVFTADHGELFGDYGFFGHRYDVLY
ncbi:MAG: sulfatase, partial [Elusimicrobiota bacterium]